MSAVHFNQSAAVNRLEHRQERQDARIQKGIESGQLTPKEANRLQARNARIDAAIEKQESQPGGLTKQDFLKDMFRMDKASLGIYAQKHDGQQRPPPPTTGSGQDGTPAPAPGPTPQPSNPISTIQNMLQALVQQLTGSSTT